MFVQSDPANQQLAGWRSSAATRSQPTVRPPTDGTTLEAKRREALGLPPLTAEYQAELARQVHLSQADELAKVQAMAAALDIRLPSFVTTTSQYGEYLKHLRTVGARGIAETAATGKPGVYSDALKTDHLSWRPQQVGLPETERFLAEAINVARQNAAGSASADNTIATPAAEVVRAFSPNEGQGRNDYRPTSSAPAELSDAQNAALSEVALRDAYAASRGLTIGSASPQAQQLASAIAGTRAAQLAPLTTRMHHMLADYHGETTPLGAAVRIWKHIADKLANQQPLDRAINDLVQDVNLLALVATSRASCEAPTVYVMDGGQFVAISQPGCVDTWVLIAQAADALSRNYTSLPEAERALSAPGIVALRSAQLNPSPCGSEKVVHFVANSLKVDAGYESAVNALATPYYKVVCHSPGVPNGVPVRTGVACNAGVPKSDSLTVTDCSGKQKSRIVLMDDVPKWVYTPEAKAALLRSVYGAIAVLHATVGDSTAELAGAALYKAALARSSETLRVQAEQPRLSYH